MRVEKDRGEQGRAGVLRESRESKREQGRARENKGEQERTGESKREHSRTVRSIPDKERMITHLYHLGNYSPKASQLERNLHLREIGQRDRKTLIRKETQRTSITHHEGRKGLRRPLRGQKS
jgi:hypothetical protein